MVHVQRNGRLLEPAEDALAILTSEAEIPEFQKTRKGRLAPEMLADLAVLSQDVTKAPQAPLPATHSVLTIIGGSGHRN